MRKHNIITELTKSEGVKKDINFNHINPEHGYTEEDIKFVFDLNVGETIQLRPNENNAPRKVTRVPSDDNDFQITAITGDDAEDRPEATEPDWRLYVSCKCGHDASLDVDEQRNHLDGFAHEMLGGLSKYTCEHCESVLIIEDELEPNRTELLEVQDRYGINLDPDEYKNLLSTDTLERIEKGRKKFGGVCKLGTDKYPIDNESGYVGAWVQCGNSPKFFCYLEEGYRVGAVVKPNFPIESVRSIVEFYSSDDGLIIDFVDDDRLYVDQFDSGIGTVTVATPRPIPVKNESVVVDVWVVRDEWRWVVVDDSETWLRLDSPCCDGAYVESWRVTNLLTPSKVFDFEQLSYTVYKCSNCNHKIDLKKMRNKKFVPVVIGDQL